jgi:hypothetical protein
MYRVKLLLCGCLIPKRIGSCQHTHYAKHISFVTVTTESLTLGRLRILDLLSRQGRLMHLVSAIN